MNRDMFCMLSDLLSFISFVNIEVDVFSKIYFWRIFFFHF